MLTRSRSQRRPKSPQRTTSPKCKSPTKRTPSRSKKAVATATSKTAGQVFCWVPALQRMLRKVFSSGKGFTSLTLDNGGRPFRVNVTRDSSGLFHATVEADYGKSKPRWDLHSAYAYITQVWYGAGTYKGSTEEGLGQSKDGRYELGCAILLVSGSTVVAIGTRITRFELRPGDTITEFAASVENSDVVYGYIVSKQGVYILPDFNCANEGFFLTHEQAAGIQTLACVNEKELKGRGTRLAVEALTGRWTDRFH